MICKKCGENLPDNARECFSCGAKVHKDTPTLDGEGNMIKPTEKMTAGQLFSDIFSDSTFLLMSILLATLSVVMLVIFINSCISGDWLSISTNAINVAAQVFFAVVLFKLYKISVSKTAADYKSTLKLLRLYCGLRIGARVLSISFIIIFMAILSTVTQGVYGLASTIYTVVIFLLPDIMLYRFSDSLYRSAVNDRIEVFSIEFLRVLFLIVGVLMAVILAIAFGVIFEALGEDTKEALTIVFIMLSFFNIAGVCLVAQEWFRKFKVKTEWL